MLKITTIQDTPDGVYLLLEGKVAEQWAALLDGVCRGHLRQHKTVQLDCEHVGFIDATGVDVLKSFPSKQVTLLRVPGFITQLLNIGAPP